MKLKVTLDETETETEAKTETKTDRTGIRQLDEGTDRHTDLLPNQMDRWKERQTFRPTGD